jgi:hypothetical protein
MGSKCPKFGSKYARKIKQEMIFTKSQQEGKMENSLFL